MTERYSCPFCGSPQQPGGAFCVMCGRPLPPATPPAVSARQAEFDAPPPSRSLDDMVFAPAGGAAGRDTGRPGRDERRPGRDGARADGARSAGARGAGLRGAGAPGELGAQGEGGLVAPYAGVGRRFLAYLVDMGISVILFAAIALVGAKVASSSADTTTSFTSRVLQYYLIALVIWLAYWIAVWAWEGASGKTLGNLIAGIVTVDEDYHQPVGFVRAATRWLVIAAGALALIIGMFVVVISPQWDKRGMRQGWHDQIARTVVLDVLTPATGYASSSSTYTPARGDSWNRPPQPVVAAADQGNEPHLYTATHVHAGVRSPGAMPGSIPLDQLPIGGEEAPAYGAGDPGQYAVGTGVAPEQVAASGMPGGQFPGMPGTSGGQFPGRFAGQFPGPDVDPEETAVPQSWPSPSDLRPAAAGPGPAAPGPAVSGIAEPQVKHPGPAAPVGHVPVPPMNAAGVNYAPTQQDGYDGGHELTPAPVVPVQLEFESGDRQLVDGPTLIGRNPQPPDASGWTLISLDDPKWSVSKTHVELGVDSSGLWVRDRWSTNGTVVSAPGMPPTIAEPGMRVRVPTGSTIYLGDRRVIVHPEMP